MSDMNDTGEMSEPRGIGDTKELLFVCTGNTCRSPLAAAIANRLFATRGLTGWHASSAGTNAWPDASASDGSLLVALENDLDLAVHRARVVTPELVRQADVILVMGHHHLERVRELGGDGRSWLLTSYGRPGAGRAVSDPFGGTLDVYRSTFDELATEIEAVVDRLAANGSAA